jgi:large subunit ribosomal protein L7Ae
VHQKKATAVALTNVKAEDNAALEKLVESANAHFANNAESRRKWGGGLMGLKTVKAIEVREKLLAAERAKKALAVM